MDFSNITNKKLLELCFRYTDGDWVALEAKISVCVLKELIEKCIEFIQPVLGEIRQTREPVMLTRCISGRQLICCENALHYLSERNLTCALNEFMDCVDNYGQAREKDLVMTVSEAVLYNSILLVFKGVLEGEN